MILLGDIGATNSRLALIKKRGKKFVNIKIYSSKLFKNISELIENYLKKTSKVIKDKVEIAILAVAGPVFDKEAFITNLSWKVSSEELKKNFKFKKVFLLNDLAALTGCINFLKEEELIHLNKVSWSQKFPKAFLALGTGVGEAILIKNKPLIILPTEAGHTFFPSLKDEEWNFLNFLKEKREELSWEMILSGKAISLWYEFFNQEKKLPEEITSLAKKGNLKARKVVFKILELIGRKVSQTVLTSLPWGGIYLAGGVILGLKDFFIDEKSYLFFKKGFLENFKMKDILEKIPLYIIVHPFPGLLGALSILRTLVK